MRGFTLIEMMVAIAIAALLLLLGGPPFTTFLRNSEIRSTSESLVNGLRAASDRSGPPQQDGHVRARKRTGADWSSGCWTTTMPRSKTLQTYNRKEAGPNSKIAITPAGRLTVAFDGLGRVVNQGTAQRSHSADRYHLHRRR